MFAPKGQNPGKEFYEYPDWLAKYYKDLPLN